MKIDVCNWSRDLVSSLELDDSVFGLVPRADILSRVIHWQLAKRRQGTHQVKERGEVSGTTKKMNKQKGSGGARHGSRRGAQFRGGGIIFGPVSRSHEYTLPKKIRRLGLKMALSAKMQSGQLIVLDNFALDSLKTSDFLGKCSFLNKKPSLLVDVDVKDTFLARAASNLIHVNVLPEIGANVYDVMKNDTLVLTVSAVKALEERLR